jgi:hypothetical protein
MIDAGLREDKHGHIECAKILLEEVISYTEAAVSVPIIKSTGYQQPDDNLTDEGAAAKAELMLD